MSKKLVAVLTALVVSGCAAEEPKFSFTHGERRGRLESNGLRFVLMPDASTELVEVDMHYEVGSKEDPPGKAGIAHLVEHLMFQLKPDGPTSPPLMQSIGDLSTFFNAYTIWDMTHYQTTGRMENLDALLKIEAMRLYYGCQTIAKEEFEREREVVRNEIRQRGGTAEGQIPQIILSSIYPKGHAYERMVGGDDSQLTSITLDDACKFIKDFYTPERATLIVAGGFEVDSAIATIQKYFAPLPKRASAPRAPVVPLVVTKDRKTIEVDIERPALAVSFPLPPSNTREGEAVLFGAQNAFGRIARKGAEYDFAYGVSPAVLGGELAPVFTIIVELKGLDKTEEALTFINSALRQAYRGFEDIGYEQLEEEKNRAKARYIEGLEALTARTDTIGKLVQFSQLEFDSKQNYIFDELDKIAKLDGSYIGSVVKKHMDPDKARIVVFKPNKEGLKGDTRNTKLKFSPKTHDEVLPDVDPKEAKRPIRIDAQLKTLAAAKHFDLPNGMKVSLLPIKSMPLISARLLFQNTGAANAPNNPQLARQAANMLSLPMDAEAFARTGVNVECGASDDTTICETGGVNLYLDVMLRGFERLIKAGTYNQEGIERFEKMMRDQMKTRSYLEQHEFTRQFLTALYGPEHPYTLVGSAGPESLGKISKSALEDYRSAHYNAGNATLVIAGDFEIEKAEALVRDIFGGWGKGAIDKQVEAAPFKRAGAVNIGVVAKEQPQMSIAIAFPAPAGVDGQQGARMILSHMLNTRVGDVRFKLGSTYGVYAGRQNKKGPTAYQIRGTVDAPRAGESIAAMRAGVEMLRTGGEQFDIDFVRARRKLISDLLGESTVTGELADRLGFMATYGLKPTYYNTLLQLIAAASPAQVRALIKTELDPNNEIIVIQGSRDQITKAFTDASIKDIKIVEPDNKK